MSTICQVVSAIKLTKQPVHLQGQPTTTKEQGGGREHGESNYMKDCWKNNGTCFHLIKMCCEYCTISYPKFQFYFTE